MMGRRLLAALVLALAVGCESNDGPPTPSPGPGSETGETITGRERIGWDQQASSASELATLRYAIYVDNARSVMADVACASSAGVAGFACSGRLPSMSNGTHVLEIAAFVESDGIVESPRSAPLRVTVTGATSPLADTSLAPGDVVTTGDGVTLVASMALEGLNDVVDLSLTRDGALLVAERAGGVVLVPADPAVPALRAETSGPLLALSAAPDFATSGHLFAMHARGAVTQLTRYRLVEAQLIERMHVIPDVGGGADPAAALRFGPDGKLYAAFGSSGNAAAAQRMSDWRGKVLRLNLDGTTPDDQPAASPVYWHGLASPRAMAWAPAGALWIAERGHDGVERLRAIGASGTRPRRTGLHASYVLPGDVGASSLAFHDGSGALPFAGNLFVAAREGAYLLRVRFDEADRARAMTSEKLLEGRLGELRAVAAAPDGALYVATPATVWRLSPLDQ
jgi:glucose/arabinose dehydrogenase